MKEKFRELTLNQAGQDRIELVNEILEDYSNQGFTLTLRQLYYQLVTRNIVENKNREYKNLGTLLVKGRMMGLVDWDAIEDRGRRPQIPYWVDGKAEAIRDTIEHYRLDRQKGQDTYVEIWVEKDALSGVIEPRTSHYHIRFMANKGYSSASAMYSASQRLIGHEFHYNQDTVILYLGDHDPSGLDMIRDIQDRLEEFGSKVRVQQIALNMKQIRELNPPPNPAKLTDSRSEWYINKYGNESWELDALQPNYLQNLINQHVEDIIDMDLFEQQINTEEGDQNILEGLADTFTETEE